MLAQTLQAAGYTTFETDEGTVALDLTRVHACDAVLLDAGLPDGGARQLCRLLKADPDLASVLVVFVTSWATIERPVSALLLDADDYVTNPVDPADVLLRLRVRLSSSVAEPEPVWSVPLLGYNAFVHAADERLARGGAALVLLTVGHDSVDDAAQAAISALEPRDLLAWRGPEHLLMLLQEIDPAAVTRQLTRLTSAVINAVPGRVHAGVSVADHAGATAAGLLVEADQALADARIHDLPFSRLLPDGDDTRPPMRTVLLADGDVELLDVVETALRESGYRPVVAGSGQAALRAVLAERPDVLVLDLGVPGLAGFDVLTRLQDVAAAQRPRLLVLSNDRDVAEVEKAFALGASDYLVKPFDVQELVARVARLA